MEIWSLSGAIGKKGIVQHLFGTAGEFSARNSHRFEFPALISGN